MTDCMKIYLADPAIYKCIWSLNHTLVNLFKISSATVFSMGVLQNFLMSYISNRIVYNCFCEELKIGQISPDW